MPTKTDQHEPMTLWVGTEYCLDRDCDDYATEDGNDDPGVDRCSHITEQQVCAACSVETPSESSDTRTFYDPVVPWPCPHATPAA